MLSRTALVSSSIRAFASQSNVRIGKLSVVGYTISSQFSFPSRPYHGLTVGKISISIPLMCKLAVVHFFSQDKMGDNVTGTVPSQCLKVHHLWQLTY